MKLFSIALLTIFFYFTDAAQRSDRIQEEVWQRELQYWKYVARNDKVGYLTLWHDNFIGYPDTDSLTPKSKIANWITDLHNKTISTMNINSQKNQ